MAGIRVGNAIDVLRVLAIGSGQLCWPDDHNQKTRSLYANHRAELELEEGGMGLKWFGDFPNHWKRGREVRSVGVL